MLNSCLKNRDLAMLILENGIGNKGNLFETQKFPINEVRINATRLYYFFWSYPAYKDIFKKLTINCIKKSSI
ncbi:hypothetical protein BpHYR1_016168 [Brachionus plicatilis]|uniref:Uncharacterized protein n=1 Tax=Brachionus plicatilis TaxID=10195 RepID=A0A3M7R2T6_BRAPC|nr:hypothetical protein BpHYR1_016168 [Brachionus plicatilis]